MPVTKYRDFEAARQDLWRDADEPRLLEAMADLWLLSRSLAPLDDLPRGVTRYRSLEEAEADRVRWERERVRRLQEQHTAR